MKTSKSALKTSAQEECGVWLDAAQLKRKAKQKQVARPVPKLLHPFLGGGGYSLSVALNFTQTKCEMPRTKQSSIATFFTPQRRVVHKMSNSEVTNVDPVQPSISSTSATCDKNAPIPLAPGKKRRREIDLDFDDPKASHEPPTENLLEEKWQPASYTHSQKMSCALEEQYEEIIPPQNKRRLRETSSLPGDSQPLPKAWSQDPLFSYSQCSEDESGHTESKNVTGNELWDPEPNDFNSLQSERAFNYCMNVEAKTSTQNTFKHNHSSQMEEEKEKSKFSPPQSPRKNSSASHIEPLSNSKSTEPNTGSPLKRHQAHFWRSNKENDFDSQFMWTKPSSSPRKKRLSCREVEEDSLAMLFTQDSEGFRVISHRGVQARSPLKDHSNLSPRKERTAAYKFLAEEDEVLFTQDSQGNLVIKH